MSNITVLYWGYYTSQEGGGLMNFSLSERTRTPPPGMTKLNDYWGRKFQIYNCLLFECSIIKENMGGTKLCQPRVRYVTGGG